MRYLYNERGFYIYNSVDTDEVLPNSTSVDPLRTFKPRIVDSLNPDSGWVIGATEAEKEYQLNETTLGRDTRLLDTSSHVSSWVKERIPINQLVLNERKAIIDQYNQGVLDVYPDYIFPDYSNIPVVEFTWRHKPTQNLTDITLPEEIDKPLRLVTINEQVIETPVYDPVTRVLQVNINAGERLVVVY